MKGVFNVTETLSPAGVGITVRPPTKPRVKSESPSPPAESAGAGPHVGAVIGGDQHLDVVAPRGSGHRWSQGAEAADLGTGVRVDGLEIPAGPVACSAGQPKYAQRPVKASMISMESATTFVTVEHQRQRRRC